MGRPLLGGVAADVRGPGGVWAIVNGISGIFVAFSLREAGERVERMLD